MQYSVDSLDSLEKLVDEQAAGGACYSLDKNLALLRFYQMAPHGSTKPQAVCKLLALALMRLPHPDFKACTHLLTEKMQVVAAARSDDG